MKLSDFSAVIFDMDGLVLDTETTYAFAKQQAAKEMGYDISGLFWLSLSGLHHNDIQKKILAHFGAEFNLQKFNNKAEQLWRDYVTVNGIKTKHGFSQLLEFIVQQSVPYCLATNSNAANANECLTYAGIQHIFPRMVTRDDVQQGKPEPDIFLKAADLLHVDIKHCLVLEDSHAGVLAASRAGAFTVLVPSASPVEHLTVALCDRMMSDLESVLLTLQA